MPASHVADPVACLKQIYDAAIERVLPRHAVLRHLPSPPKGRCVVVGAGKASAAMAATIDAAWPEVDLSGVVSTRYDHAVDAGRIRIIEAGHPVPDRCSELSALAVLDAVRGLTSDDLIIALISGGGSSTMALPVAGITLADKQALTKALLKSGAGIEEINTVRKHLSQIKGGGLAAAAGDTPLLTLLISDIPGDNAAAIASGPTFPCGSSSAQALAILESYDIEVPEELRQALVSSSEKYTGHRNHCHQIIARPADALQAAADEAGRLGFNTLVLGDAIEADSTEFGKVMAGIARSAKSSGQPVSAPAAIISGGETTVSIGPEGAGRGGRNTEFALSMACALDGESGIYALACDSDGIDGTEDAAGAIISPNSLAQAARKGLNANQVLAAHDSYSFFDALDTLIKTGPTLTNVNDIRIVLLTEDSPLYT